MTDVDQNLQNEISRLESSIQHQLKALADKERVLNDIELARRQGLGPSSNPAAIEANLKSALPGFLMPGNVGEINRVIWPFMFSTVPIILTPGNTVRRSISITQEAAFVLMHYTRAIYKVTGGANIEYIQPSETNYEEAGLTFDMTDPQSGRSFFTAPVELRQLGDPRYPAELRPPRFMLPNSNYFINFTNNSPTALTLMPVITFHGYRVRIDSAQNILSTVYG
jgi:hypothetical protein